MKIALTGAGGFLGRALLQEISKISDISAVAFTSKKEKLHAAFLDFKNITIADNRDIVNFCFQNIDILINCAFPMSAKGEEMASGLQFINTVLCTAVDSGVGSVINISSQSVYSQKRKEAADESTPPVLENEYAIGKYASELLTNSICREIPHSNLRLASLIGTDLDRRVVNKFIKQILSRQQIKIIGGSQRFGYLDVRDAAKGITKMLKVPAKKWDSVYNLGQNKAYTLLEIAECAKDVASEYGIVSDDIYIEDSDIWQNSEIDCSLFFNTFNWKPEYTLKDSTRDIFEKERENIGKK